MNYKKFIENFIYTPNNGRKLLDVFKNLTLKESELFFHEVGYQYQKYGNIARLNKIVELGLTSSNKSVWSKAIIALANKVIILSNTRDYNKLKSLCTSNNGMDYIKRAYTSLCYVIENTDTTYSDPGRDLLDIVIYHTKQIESANQANLDSDFIAELFSKIVRYNCYYTNETVSSIVDLIEFIRSYTEWVERNMPEPLIEHKAILDLAKKALAKLLLAAVPPLELELKI